MCFAVVYSASHDDAFPISKVVKLEGSHGQCSGEQIRAPSGQTYILSAGHCKNIGDGQSVIVKTEDGRRLERKIIAEDPNSDLLLIEGVPNMSGLKIGNHSEDMEHIRTFTHGGGLKTFKTEGMLVEKRRLVLPVWEINDKSPPCNLPKYKEENFDTGWGFSVAACMLDVQEYWTTAMVIPGSSGGMVINDDNELIGVVSIKDGEFSGIVDQVEINKFIRNY